MHGSPGEVAPKARAFSRAVIAFLPHYFRYRPQVESLKVGQMKSFLGAVSPFPPDNPLHGLDPELLAVQRKVIEDVSSLVDFIAYAGHFDLTRDGQYFVANDGSEEGDTVRSEDALIRRIGEMCDRISTRWGQGRGYYSPE